MKCKECKSEFEATGRAHRVLCCSTPCKRARVKRLRKQYQKRIVEYRECDTCGKRFKKWRRNIYCSDKCKADGRQEKSGRNPTVKCKSCRKEFVSGWEFRTVCSDACKVKWERVKAKKYARRRVEKGL